MTIFSQSRDPRAARPKKKRVSIGLPESIVADLRERCEKSGRSPAQEIEAALRATDGPVFSDDTILVRLDRGLAAYVRALMKSGVNLYGDAEDIAIWAIRQFIIETWDSEPFAHAMFKHLPESIQKAWMNSPRFQKLQMPLFGDKDDAK